MPPAANGLNADTGKPKTAGKTSRLVSRIDLLKNELSRRNAADSIEKSLPLKARALITPARYKALYGGRGSAKSQTMARLLLAKCKRKPGTRWLCGREIQLSLEHSVKRLLSDLIRQFNIQDDFEILNTQIKTPGDGVIIFQGLQNHTVDSIKSLEGFDGAWIEEAQGISARSLELLRPTFRREDSELWFSWNPERASDPVEFLRHSPPNDSIVVEMNWQDNPYFPEVLRREMEGDYARDPEGASHVWAGKYRTRSQATVFKNWKVLEFDTPYNAPFLFGGDWGFANDPTVLIRCWIDEPNERRLYIDREVYKIGCEIDDTPALFDEIDPQRPCLARGWKILADSARPETISYMQRHGYPRLEAAKKGPGSVEEGVKFLQNFNEIIIHPRCTHTREEFTDYSYKVHPLTGEVMPILEDKKNHVIDAVRYAVEDVHQPRSFLTW